MIKCTVAGQAELDVEEDFHVPPLFHLANPMDEARLKDAAEEALNLVDAARLGLLLLNMAGLGLLIGMWGPAYLRSG